ncbi:MAG TPA: sulfotransferase, partial [Erythrobacter sp.]|nr:sulfotransferase [Erythrobacter sp.]
AMKQFHHILRDRLYAQMWFKRHPEILARPLRNPVVIVGPMRSGTTRLHR